MASINFLDARFQPHISCSKPSLDGHDVSNLIAANQHVRNKGFIGESFVKPPVNIDIHFPCNIDIHRVTIGCKVGNHATAGLQIFTHSAKWDEAKCWLLHDVDASFKSLERDDEIFTSVARGFTDQHNVISFVNRRFSSRYPFRTWPKATSNNSQGTRLELNFPHHDHWHLNNVSHLSIRIFKTKSYMCAVSFIEVWAQPSLECSKHKALIAALRSFVTAPSSLSQPQPEPNASQPTTSKRKREDGGGEGTEEEIPTEFLDPLTNTIMRLPCLLPCGESIDQSSLDRYCEEEAKYGRPPNDPFTAQPFSATTKPLPNAALKLRIDHFLMHNIPKTHLAIVGSSNQHAAHVSSLIARHNTHSAIQSCQPRESPLAIDRPTKHTRTDENITTTKDEGCIASTGDATNVNASHSCNLKSSLDAALFSALGETPERRTVDLDAKTNTNCVKCKATSGLYKLDCSHILCRPCLLERKASDSRCPSCSIVFSHRDVVKVHN